MPMEIKIYYHDTDAGGVVYYGNYLKFFEESRTEFLENKGLPVKDLHDQGFFYAVRKCNISYRSPARYGDTIVCEAEIKELSAAQIIFDQKIFHKTDKRLLVEAEVYLVSLDKNFKPIPIPEDIRKKLT